MTRVRTWWRGRNRWLRRLIVAGAAVLVLALIATVGAGYYFSEQLLDPEIPNLDYDVEVLEVAPVSTAAPRTVTLERTEETLRDGVFGLDTDSGGHAILGRIVDSGDEGVTRRVTEVQGELDRGTMAFVNTVIYNGNPEQSLGLAFQAIDFESKLGPMAAWYRPGQGDTWAVMIHGYKTSRRGGLRDYRLLRDFGLPTLSVTYRNDPGNPEAPDGLIQLGQQEWLDLESAMEWAVDRGAERFVVFGDSMGGAITCTLYHRSELADRIDALVLDAPVLDWEAVLDLQGSERGLPSPIISAAELWITTRIGFDFADFDQISMAKAFDLPILLFHGTADEVVPFETSEQFAAALPDLVTFYPAEGAGHVQAWNIGPELYEERLSQFLADVVGLGPP